MQNPFGPYGALNPFKSTRSYSTGIEPATSGVVSSPTYFYEESGLKTTFSSPEQLTAYVAKRDAEERTPKILTAVAVLLILAGIWFAWKKK